MCFLFQFLAITSLYRTLKYALLPDANSAFQNHPDVPYRENQYGQLLDIYYVIYVEEYVILLYIRLILTLL
jgi:hypothetical protein